MRVRGVSWCLRPGVRHCWHGLSSLRRCRTRLGGGDSPPPARQGTLASAAHWGWPRPCASSARRRRLGAVVRGSAPPRAPRRCSDVRGQLLELGGSRPVGGLCSILLLWRFVLARTVVQAPALCPLSEVFGPGYWTFSRRRVHLSAGSGVLCGVWRLRPSRTTRRGGRHMLASSRALTLLRGLGRRRRQVPRAVAPADEGGTQGLGQPLIGFRVCDAEQHQPLQEGKLSRLPIRPPCPYDGPPDHFLVLPDHPAQPRSLPGPLRSAG